MTKWKYAYATYSNGLLDPHIEMSDMCGDNGSIGHFLQEAGEKGWELCGVLPYPSSRPTTDLCVIFKRPAD